jgi:hypothetical protein
VRARGYGPLPTSGTSYQSADRAAAQPCTALGREQSRIAHLRHHLHVGCERGERLEGDQKAAPLVPFTNHLSVPRVTVAPGCQLSSAANSRFAY